MSLILLLVALLLPVQTEIKPEALEWFRKGEAMIGTDRAYSPEQAESFKKAVEAQPDFAAARYNLALTYLGQGLLDLALEQLHALSDLEPDRPRSHVLSAEIHLRANRPSEAERELRTAIALNPEDAEAWVYLGRAQFQREQYEEALQSQRKAAGLAPELDSLDFDQAVTLERLGRNREAADKCRSYLTKHDDDVVAHTLLADVLAKSGEKEEALQHLRKAEELAPSDPEIRERAAYLLLDMGKLDEAKERLEGSNSPAALANLGLIARKQGRLDDAIAYLTNATTQAPENPDLWLSLADALFAKHDETHAIAAYEKAVALGASDFETLFNLGALYANQDDTTKAREWLGKALEANPNSGAAHFSLGIVLERLGEPDQAFDQYRLAVDNGAGNARLHFRLAVLYARRGDSEEALGHLQRCLEMEAAKYLPIIDKELLNVHSDFDSIRYSLRFAELLKKYRSETAPQD